MIVSNAKRADAVELIRHRAAEASCSQCGSYRKFQTDTDILLHGLVSMIREGRLQLVEPCLECVEKHVGQAVSNLETTVGQAMVKANELLSGYPDRYLLVIGHLADAADEADAWPELKQALLEARRDFQREGAVPDWKKLGRLIAAARNSSV